MNSTGVTVHTQTPLFRPEVLQARQSQWLGSIRVSRYPSFRLIAGASLGLVAAVIALACWGEFTRKISVHGVLLPVGGLINVSAFQAGVISELFVHEGEDVRAGQPLLRLKSERMTDAGDAAALQAQGFSVRRASLQTERRLTDQNLQQRLEAIAQRLQSLQIEERQAQAELDTHRLRIQLAQKSVERQSELAKSGFVAIAQVQQKQEELLDLQLRERNAERNLQSLQRDLQATRDDKAAAETLAKATLAQLDRSIATLDQDEAENAARQGLTITAPHAGRVSVTTLNTGQSVQVAQTLMTLIPKGANDSGTRAAELQAQLYAPSRMVGFVKIDQAVWMRYAAFPYQKFGMAKGRVVAVSKSPIAAEDLPPGQGSALLAAARANEPLYRITVRLDSQALNTYGTATPLTAGTSLDADIVQETRKIWEWAFEPLLAALEKYKSSK